MRPGQRRRTAGEHSIGVDVAGANADIFGGEISEAIVGIAGRSAGEGTQALEASIAVDGTTLRRSELLGVDLADSTAATVINATIVEDRPLARITSSTGVQVHSGATVFMGESRIEGLHGHGMTFLSSAWAVIFDTTVTGTSGTGIGVSDPGTNVTLIDTTIVDTGHSEDGGNGIGISVYPGASVLVVGGEISRNSTGGLHMDQYPAEDGVAHVDVHGTVLEENGQYPVGVPPDGCGMCIDAGELSFADGALNYNIGNGLTAGPEAVVHLENVSIDGTGQGGENSSVAVSAHLGASIHMTDVTVSNTIGTAVLSQDGSHVDLDRVEVVNTQPGLTEFEIVGTRLSATGVRAQDATMTMASSIVTRTQGGVGIHVIGPDARLDLFDSVVEDTRPDLADNFGYGMLLEDGTTASLVQASLKGNRNLALYAMYDCNATLIDVTLADTQRTSHYASATGLTGTTIQAERLDVWGTEGPGIRLVRGTMDCIHCNLIDNRFAGAVQEGGVLNLQGATIADNGEDVQQKGGVGILVDSAAAPGILSLRTSSVTEHHLGGVVIYGPGTYELEGNQIWGGSDATFFGNAVYVEDGVTAWNGVDGLRLTGNNLHGGAGPTVLFHDASGDLCDNHWPGSLVDLHVQACENAELPLCYHEVSHTEICPSSHVSRERLLYTVGLYEALPH